MGKDSLNSLLDQLDKVSDDYLDSDLYTAIQLKRIASNIAMTMADNDFLINSLDIDTDTKEKIQYLVKEAVAISQTKKRKVAKKAPAKAKAKKATKKSR